MRILQVTPTYLPAVRYGGPIFAVHGLSRALAARGHDVHVFTTNVDGAGVSPVPLDRPSKLDGVEVHYFPSRVKRLYWSPQLGSALTRHIRSFDLVHSHAVFLWPGVAAAQAARRAGVPFVLSPRGMLVPELIEAKSRLAKRAWLRFVEGRSLASATIHFTSILEQEDAGRLAIPFRSSFVIPNGIDIVARPPVVREANTLLYLGRISWKKRIDRIIEILPSLSDTRLIVAGNDDEGLTPALANLARRLGVDDRVDFRGAVYGEAKYALLASATLFVLPSESENFGNTVLEALSMETPVVLASGVALARDVEAAGAGIVGLEAIGPLLRDTEKRSAMGRNGRRLVESRFAWDTVAEAMERQYEMIAHGRTR